MFDYSIVYLDAKESIQEFCLKNKETKAVSDAQIMIETAKDIKDIVRIHNLTTEKTIYSNKWDI